MNVYFYFIDKLNFNYLNYRQIQLESNKKLQENLQKISEIVGEKDKTKAIKFN